MVVENLKYMVVRALKTFFKELKKTFSSHDLEYYQSNHEGYLIDKLHEVGFTYDGIVLNPGGYTHTSIALRDAIASIETPVYEVHISKLSERENFRQISYVREVCVGTISGIGLRGYEMALKSLIGIS